MNYICQTTFGRQSFPSENQPKRRIKTVQNQKVSHNNSCDSSKIAYSNVLNELLNWETEASTISRASSKEKLISKKDQYKITYTKQTESKNNSRKQNNGSASKIPAYANFAKLIDEKNQKIVAQEQQIQQLNQSLQKYRHSIQQSHFIFEQKQKAEDKIEELKQQVADLRESELYLQTRVQILEKQKQNLAKKCSLYLAENEELTIKITSLKEEYLSKLPNEKRISCFKQQIAILKEENRQLKQLQQERICVEQKVCALQKKLNEYVFKYDEVQTENNNWQIKYYKIQKEHDNNKLEMHELEVNNRNLHKLIQQERQMHNQQLQKWKARITKMQENSLTDRLKTESQYQQAMAAFNQLEGRCHKLQIESVLEQKLLEKDKEIIVLKKKQKQNEVKQLELQRLIKEYKQQLLSKEGWIIDVENQLAEQKIINELNNNKINQLKREKEEKVLKISEFVLDLSAKQSYISKLEEKCRQMIEQNERVTQICETRRNQTCLEIQNLKSQIESLNKIISNYHQNVDYLHSEMRVRDQKIEQIMNKSQIARSEYMMNCRQIQMKCQEYQRKQQELTTQIQIKDKQCQQLSHQLAIKNGEISQLSSSVDQMNAEISTINTLKTEAQLQLHNLAIKFTESQNKVYEWQKSSEILQQTINKLSMKTEQETLKNKELSSQLEELHKRCNQYITKITQQNDHFVQLNYTLQEEKSNLLKVNLELESKAQQRLNIGGINQRLREQNECLATTIRKLEEDKRICQDLINKKDFVISQLNERTNNLNTFLFEKEFALQKLTTTYQAQIQKTQSIHLQSSNKIQSQFVIEQQKWQQKTFQLQSTIEVLKKFQSQLFSKYDQIFKTNLEKDKTIHELREIISKNQQGDIKYLKNQIQMQKINNRKLKQFNAKLNEQYEEISEKYIKTYKQLQSLQVYVGQLKQYTSELEKIVKQEQNKVDKLVKIEEMTSNQNKQHILRYEEAYLQEKQQLEESIKFLSQQLKIWSHKYETANKQIITLKAELDKLKGTCKAVTQSCKTAPGSISNSIILAKSNNNIKNNNIKDLQRQVQKYKVQASILKQENAVLEDTLNVELQKRKQIIESLIRQKNILYQQITASSRNI